METERLRINYIIGAWGGKRRRMQGNLSIDREYHLVEHVNRLSTLKNAITQVTIVNADSKDTPIYYYDYLKYITSKGIRRKCDCVTIPVRLICNINNFAGVYGSWFIGYDQTEKEFDYYIFFEDDYVPSLDNFDIKLIECLQTINCGYLCAYTRPRHFGVHAGVASGLITKVALETAHPRLVHYVNLTNEMILDKSQMPNKYAEITFFQYKWARSFNEVGIKIADIGGFYDVKFSYINGKKFLVHEYNRRGKFPMIMECL